jgi:hypothetical protein
MTRNELALDRGGLIDIDAAYQTFKRTGYVLFERVLPRDLVDDMRAVWEEYFTPFSRRRPHLKRFLMHVPFKAPLYDPRFLEDPQVLAIADRVLGRNYVCGYFGSETPLPGAGYMNAHFDLAFITKMTFLNHPLSFANKLLGSAGYHYGIQVSAALVDSREDNAPFEIWPATNRFARRRQSEVLLMPAGSLLVRDIRNLHRGTPHHGTAARPFLSLVYLRPWVPRWKAPEIPRDVYANLTPRSQRLFRFANIGRSVPDPEAWAQRAR